MSYSIPFHDDFDSLNLWQVQTNQGCSWQLGMPAYGQTNSVHSGLNAWDVQLSGSYQDSSVTILTSPHIDFTGVYNARLSFWQNFNSEPFLDGTHLEYSIDGFSWIVLGRANEPDALNWYTHDNIASSNLPAWSGNSAGWIQSACTLVPLNGFTGQVQFRFVFTSNDSIHLDGHTIDDFAIDLAPNLDAGIIATIEPTRFSVIGSMDTVKAVIKNFGGFPLDSLTLFYQVNTKAPVSQTWSGHLLPSFTDTVSFLVQFTVPAGDYDLCVFTLLSGDGNAANDALCARYDGVPVFSIPYADQFDAATAGWYDSSLDGTSWQQGIPSFGTTNSSWSSPQCWDINLDTAYANHAKSFLYSPFFDFTGVFNARLSFFQNRNTETRYDGMNLEFTTDGGYTWSALGYVGEENSGNWYNDSSVASLGSIPGWDGNSQGWQKSSCVLSALNNTGSQVQFRFHFASDGSHTADGCSVDDFSLLPAPPADLSLNQILSPLNQMKCGDVDSIRVHLRNLGTSDITSFRLYYGIEGTALRSYSWNGTLHPSETIDLTVDTLVYRNSNFTLIVIDSLNGDADQGNDTLRKNLFGIPVLPLPFADNFESTQNFYVCQGNEDWQWGVPQANLINFAFSGSQCWKTNLLGDYKNMDYTILYSPFFDFSHAYHPQLKFRHWYSTEPGKDGGRLEYSKNAGSTWMTLGSRSDVLATNWYSSNGLAIIGKPGWEGNSNGWIQSSYNLDSISGYASSYIQFRYIFNSNDSVGGNGWAIDDFSIESMPALSASPVHWSGLPDPFFPATNFTPGIYLKNSGASSLQSVDIRLSVDGITSYTDSVYFGTGLASKDSVFYTFPGTFQLSAGSHELCIATSNPNHVQDELPQDDSICVLAGRFDTVIVGNTSWCDDFDAGTSSWLSMDPASHSFLLPGFSRGLPQKQFLNGTYNGSQSWTTDLVRDYSSGRESALISPVFEVDSGACYAMDFFHRYKTELFQDGGTVEYSTDDGNSWSTVGQSGEAQWFNSNYITGLKLPPVPGWSGISSGWEEARHEMYFPAQLPVIFRFRFGSDASVEDEGWEIDQFCFTKLPWCVIGIEELIKDKFRIFPNPATDQINLEFPEMKPTGNLIITLENALGQEVKQLEWNSESGNAHVMHVNLEGLSQGIYFVKILSSGYLHMEKFLKAE